MLVDEQSATSPAPAEAVYARVTGVGGERGWYVTPLLWSLRGGIDKLIGGVGMRRRRRHPDQLRGGRRPRLLAVEAVEAPRLVRLRAEMRLPGDAWLEWHIEPVATGSRLTQRAIFYPRAHRARLLVRPAALPRTDLRPPRPPPGGGAVGDDPGTLTARDVRDAS